MTSKPTSRNLAARAGRWSAQHRRKAILGWLAFVVLAVFVGQAVGTKQLSQSDSGTGESARATRTLEHNGFPSRADESVLIQGRHGQTAADPAVRAAVADVARRVAALPQVANVRTPFQPGHAGQISRDRRSAVVQFEIRGDADTAKDRIQPVLDRVAAVQRAHPELRVEEFGDASADKALSKSLDSDFKRAEVLSIPITLAILIVAFGALVAAGIPVLLALSAVAATLGLVAIPSQWLPVDQATSSVVLLIGLAVGVDYTLFYLRREREERAAGRSEAAALEAAAATSGRAVLVSGLTVMLAMAGMYLTGDKTFSAIATGAIMVVGIAMLGSVTVLPALLSKLGDRVDRGRVPLLARLRERRQARGSGGLWAGVVDRVLRRPALSAAVSAAVLIALAIPAFGLHTLIPGADGLPRDMPIVKTYAQMQKAFPGGDQPATVVVKARDVQAPAAQRAIAELRSRALASGQMNDPIEVRVNHARTVAAIDVPLQGSGTDDASLRALATLRGDIVPATVGRLPGAEVATTGMTAGTKDFNDEMKSTAPIVFAFVLGMAFLLLLVTFRSIVIPIKAIALNLLSVGAAYGVLVLVFQHTWAEGLLSFHSIGGITAWLPVFLFVVLFGLSMDYHVLILSRIREAYDGGMRTEDAVAHGIKATAGVVTSAAVVMVAVFAIFATLSQLEMKQLGVGLAVAVLIDATLVRAVLLPATMKLLGHWNWYLPRRLEWLPRLAPEPA